MFFGLLEAGGAGSMATGLQGWGQSAAARAPKPCSLAGD